MSVTGWGRYKEHLSCLIYFIKAFAPLLLPVLILDGGYFPAIVYVGRGDNIIFTNNSEAEHTMSGPEGTWVSEPIPVDGTYVLNINNQLAPTYSGAGADDVLMEGSFSYEPAPLTE